MSGSLTGSRRSALRIISRLSRRIKRYDRRYQDTAFAEDMAGDQQVHQPKRPALPGLHCPKATIDNGAGLGPGQNLQSSQR
jgi:hypothetical protein